jgi:DNA-binding transcriptional LysR family regulator
MARRWDSAAGYTICHWRSEPSSQPKAESSGVRIDLTDLRLFVNVARTKSITRGAELSHLSLAAASARLSSMEEELGARLFERKPRGVRLLPAGETVFEHADSILRLLDHLAIAIRPYANGERQVIRILANTAAMADVLPAALPGYLADHPGISVDVEERPSREIALELARGSFDFGVLADMVDLGSLHTIPVRRDDLVLIAAKGHELDEKRTLRLTEVRSRPFVGLAADAPLQNYIESKAADAGITLTMRLRAQSFDSLCESVRKGIGLAVVPAAVVQRHAADLIAIELEDGWAKRTLKIGMRDPAALSGPARELVEHICTSAGCGASL